MRFYIACFIPGTDEVLGRKRRIRKRKKKTLSKAVCGPAN